MTYAIITILLFAMISGYFKLADKYNIIDKPNERSSHTKITIRGGGIIFPVAACLWAAFFGVEYPYFLMGLIAISVISFIDDRYTISVKPRLAVHFMSVCLMIYELGIFETSWYWWAVAFIMIVGWINAFNFMDGINGITVFYALVTLASLAWINQTEFFVDQELLIVSMIGAGVFAFFNARTKAKTFAGDIGSVSMAFILGFAMIRLIQKTGDWEYILLVSVYGVDSVLTIVQRLLKKENIFKPHRSHLYQYMANELKIPHIAVSLLYALLQLGINYWLFHALSNRALDNEMIAVATLLGLGAMYIAVKFILFKKILSQKTA